MTKPLLLAQEHVQDAAVFATTRNHPRPNHPQSPAIESKSRMVSFKIAPSVGHRLNGSRPAWKADLRVTTGDLPRLTRNGFYWKEGNILKEKGSIFGTVDGTLDKAGFRWTRRYELTDLADEPQWTAELFVFARQIKMLSCFKVGDLSPDLVYRATAQEKLERFYFYDVRAPQKSFNAIYDDMPLTGWWPWPRLKEASDTGGELICAGTREA